MRKCKHKFTNYPPRLLNYVKFSNLLKLLRNGMISSIGDTKKAGLKPGSRKYSNGNFIHHRYRDANVHRADAPSSLWLA